MRLGIVVHPIRESAASVGDRLTAAARARGWEVGITGIGTWDGEPFDVLVGVGGDGTLLEAAHLAHRADIPVAGVNLGTVGYLADFDPADDTVLLDTLALDPLPTIGRMSLRATSAGGESWHGINDVVLEKVLSQRIVQLTVDLDGERFTTYRADGLIVATPLGSTAYSLSAGGPVVDPAVEALVLTPVAPHSLLSRSLVLAPGTVVTCTVDGDRRVRVNLDGREATTLEPGDVLTIGRGERPVRFVSMGGRPFPEGLRRQFGLDHA
jgi:NAD+ kinase